jgi:hypothetical protein
VILEIAGLLADHGVIARDAAPRHRVAFLKATEPTFLVFAASQRHPIFMAKIGRRDALERRADITSRLHAMLGNGIARPVGVFSIDDQRTLLVEEGLAGLPWFRLGDWCRTPADWRALRQRAIATLREFRTAVATQPDWVSAPRRLDGEVRQMAVVLRDELAPLGPRVDALIDSAAAELASLGAVPSVHQHGDFVLNNLLVDRHQLAVLDFADFGTWRAPFIDVFALAYSVNFLASEQVAWTHLSEDLAACAVAEDGADAYSPRQKVAFFVYFLLAATIDTLHKPTRHVIRSLYAATLRELLDGSSRYENAFAAASLRRM